MKPEKRSVAVVVRDPDARDRILAVLRPEDDEDLPSSWGLPAASLRPGESWKAAARRAGREKLGVSLHVDAAVGEDRMEREDYVLWMRVFAAEIVEGRPEVSQPVEGMTRYSDWRWAPAEQLVPAARAGSLCSRVYLRSRNLEW